MAGVRVRAVEHDIVGAEEAGLGHDLEAEAEDLAFIDGVGVGIADLEGGYAGCGSVEVELIMSFLGISAGEEFGVSNGVGFEGKAGG